jgi:hypothetical protein
MMWTSRWSNACGLWAICSLSWKSLSDGGSFDFAQDRRRSAVGGPRVSVVMSVYNGERYLREAVESILNQTFTDLEFIIVDDGSTDSTWQILTAYAAQDPQIVLIRNEENIGLTRSLNKGLGLARGMYVARQDADDVSWSTRLQDQIQFMEQYPEVGLVGSAFELIDETGRRLGVVKLPTGNAQLQESLRSANCFCHGSVMIRRQCLQKVGGYREVFAMAQDYDLWLRIAEQFDLGALTQILYRSRLNADSVTMGKRAQQNAYGALSKCLALQRQETEIDALQQAGDDSSSEWLRAQLSPTPEMQARALLEVAILNFLRGQIEEAVHNIDAVISSYPTLLAQSKGFFVDLVTTWAIVAGEGEAGSPKALAFVTKVFDNLPPSAAGLSALRRGVLSRVHVAAAFESHASSDRPRVRHHVTRAVLLNPRWCLNRGIVSIFASVLFRDSKM